MKFYKRQNLSKTSPQDNTWAVEADGRIVTTSKVSLQTPVGDVTFRPAEPQTGMIRYNTDLGVNGELEVYINDHWEILKTNRQQVITKQEFDNGDYADTIFGPLEYDVDITKPENIMVYVENVWQIPGTNYELVYNSLADPITTATVLTQLAPISTTTIYVETVADFNPGQSLTGVGITGNTVVDTSSTDMSITITPGTSSEITSGTTIIAAFNVEGTYVKFTPSSFPVPFKPVIVLQGFDGYGPPFEIE